LQATPLRPGDAFDYQADWAKILEPAGWTFVGSTRDGEERWRRPGKHHGVSATINYADLDRLYVFSSSAHPFQAGRMYTKFQAFALLRHGGDYRSAAGELRKNGFGGRPGFSTPIQSLADRVRLASGSSYRARRM
jgi:putative DNA primase/helicase